MGFSSVMGVLHRTHFLINDEHVPQETIWPQGFNNTLAVFTEHTRHSSICIVNKIKVEMLYHLKSASCVCSTQKI